MSSIEIAILTKSSKFGNLCVAGIDIKTKNWVRLTNDRNKQGALSNENMKCSDGSMANILDVVKVNILRAVPTKIQPENVLIDTKKRFIKIKTMTLEEVLKIYSHENHSLILGNDSYVIYQGDIEKVGYSLTLIKVKNANIYTINSYGRNKTKIDFNYNNKNYSNISVTDSDYYDKDSTFIQNAILVISLPDDEWSQENGYYKFVAKIFPL